MLARALAASACVAALTTAALVLPAGAAHAAPRATTVVLPIPKSGDLTYGVAQVRLRRTQAPRPGAGARIFRTKVGGLKVAARSKGWAKRARTTKVRVAVTRVSGGGKRMRNVVFLVGRKRAGATQRGGKVRFTIRNAAPVVQSFWVKDVDRRGRADIFHTVDAFSTALDNWSRYLVALKAAQALKAAHDPVDATGELSSNPRADASARAAKVHTAGMKVSPRAAGLLRLMYATLNDRGAYQSVKRSPLVAQFLERDLNNRPLAQRWRQVVEELPTAVPDSYAASAKQEAKFGKVTAPRISRKRVVIADTRNSSSQAAIETPRTVGGNIPGTPVEIRIAGSGTGRTYLTQPSVDPNPCTSRCTKFFTSGARVQVEAYADNGSELVSWQGCTESTTGNMHGVQGFRCNLKIDATKVEPTRVVIATFDRTPPPAPPVVTPPRGFTEVPSGGSGGGGGGGGGGGTPTPPAPDQPTFSSTTMYGANSHPVAVAAADFNLDGARDVATPEDAIGLGATDEMEVFPGQIVAGRPNGRLDPASASIILGADADPTAAVTADMTDDGLPDVAVALARRQTDDGRIALVRGTSTGLSGSASFIETGRHPEDVAAGDLNDDGKPELATAGPDGVSIHLNRGAGAIPQFAAPQTVGTGGADAGSVAIGDLDDDGDPDLVVGNLGDGSVTVLRNTTPSHATTMTFAAPVAVLSTPADRYPVDVQVADVDADGKRDVVVANHVLDSITVLRNTSTAGTPSFTAANHPSSGGDPLGQRPTGIAAADFDADGRTDLAVSNFVTNNMSLLLGTGGGAFGAASHWPVDLGPRGLIAANMDDNAKPDLVIAAFGRYPDGGVPEATGSIGVLLAG
jgi:hypothetical protein